MSIQKIIQELQDIPEEKLTELYEPEKMTVAVHFPGVGRKIIDPKIVKLQRVQ